MKEPTQSDEEFLAKYDLCIFAQWLHFRQQRGNALQIMAPGLFSAELHGSVD